MRTCWMLVSTIGLSIGGIATSGCDDEPDADADSDVDSDGDTDVDGDTDGDGDADIDSDGDADVDADGDVDATLEDLLDAAGFDLQAGSLALVDFSECCEWVSCFGNNPSSPYLAISLPRAEGQSVPNPDEDDDGNAIIWRVRADEAVVLVGRTPPRAAYFGYTLDLFDRERPGLLRDYILGSIGDTINNLTIGTEGLDGAPFEQRMAIIITPNSAIEAPIRAALVASGLPDRAINVLPIPTPLARPGIEREADTFQLLHRVALFEDGAEGDAYLADNGATVLRVTPRDEIDVTGYATPPLRPHGTGTTEASLQASLDRLHEAILAAHPVSPRNIDELEVANRTPWQIDQFGYYCIENGVNCLADNHDTLYPISELFPLRRDDVVVVWGVNHEATGKATYSNFTVYGPDHIVGIVSVNSRQLAGSAADYIPDDPNVDMLYAWTIARECGEDPHCVEIPTGCPGIDMLGQGYLAFRMYMEPETATSPHPDELLLDSATWFRP